MLEEKKEGKKRFSRTLGGAPKIFFLGGDSRRLRAQIFRRILAVIKNV